MNKFSFKSLSTRLLIAGVLSAALILGACGSDDSSVLLPEESSSSIEEVSSSVEQLSSSSSVEEISSSSQKSGPTAWDYMNPGLSYGELVDSRDNKVYKTIEFDGKTWMAENLNYDVGDTVHTWCARENCDLFGRLYTYAVAMDSAKSGCGFMTVCSVPKNFQGICPEGWHVLEYEEIDGPVFYQKNLFGAGAPKWEDSLNTNVYGLTFLPAGFMRYSMTGTSNLETWNAYFWTTMELSDSLARAYMRNSKVSDAIYAPTKASGLSVRCIKNYERHEALVDPSTVKKGEFTDARDEQTYKTVTIGRQTWMAENLNYADSVKTPVLEGRVKSAYLDDPDSNKFYGRLYTWAAAMDSGAFDYSFLTKHVSQKNIRGICPEGWHLPNRIEFAELLESIGGAYKNAHALKSNVGWDKDPGDDEYGFALVGAGRVDTTDNDIYATYGGSAFLWTAEPYYDIIPSFIDKRAHVYTLDERHVVYSEYMADTAVFKSGFNSIRCLKDEIADR